MASHVALAPQYTRFKILLYSGDLPVAGQLAGISSSVAVWIRNNSLFDRLVCVLAEVQFGAWGASGRQTPDGPGSDLFAFHQICADAGRCRL